MLLSESLLRLEVRLLQLKRVLLQPKRLRLFLKSIHLGVQHSYLTPERKCGHEQCARTDYRRYERSGRRNPISGS